MSIENIRPMADEVASLMVARFGTRRGATVTVGRLVGPDFGITQTRLVSREAAIHRLDLAHYEFVDFNQTLTRRNGFSSLAQLGAGIRAADGADGKL